MPLKKFVKRFFRILLIAILIFAVAAPFFITFTDHTPYQEMPYYKEMMSRLDSISTDSEKGIYFKAGWAKENITPEKPLPIASYGLRSDNDGVRDSLWVRTFVFGNGTQKAAMVSLDLLIFPPEITEKLKSKLPSGFSLNNTYLSATHTHNGAGGWAKGAAGVFLAGKYQDKYVDKVVEAIRKSIIHAESTLEDASLGTARFNAFYLVRNRLINNAEVDPWLRILKIKKESGETAVLSTFSAHPTCISSKIDLISRDYPGALVDSLEKSSRVDFASFMAGAVGSHAPREYRMKNFNLAGFIGHHLSHQILNSIDTISLKKPLIIKTLNVPLSLRDPHLKLSKRLRLRPWVFNWLLGKYTFYIKALRIGDTVLIGLPCDFSGTMVNELENAANSHNYQLLVTSFNGGYLGYITEDQYYDLKKGETRDMNWFGPYNGKYFSEIIEKILSII